MTVKPFSPDQARAAKVTALPDELIQAINELLTEQYRDNRSLNLTGTEILKRVHKIVYGDEVPSNGLITRDWYDRGFMDFESVYIDNGWNVSYTKGDYTDTFDPYYTFEPKVAHPKRI